MLINLRFYANSLSRAALTLSAFSSAAGLGRHAATRNDVWTDGAQHFISLARLGPTEAPHVLLLYDMEGVSTVVRNSMTICRNKEDYARGQAGLVSDVNAVVAGLAKAGAGMIEVVDGHGSGCDDDVPRALLDSHARYLDTKADTTPFWRRHWDAAVFVGMHAGSGSGGFLPHTTVYGFTRLINGTPISESEQLAYQLGENNIPVIFESGDDVLRGAIRQSMPWVEYVEVKRAVNVACATPYDAAEVSAKLRTGAERALRNRASAKLLRLTTPFQAGLRALPPMTSFRVLSGVPGVVMHGDAVEFAASSMDAARAGWMALVRVGNTVLRLDMAEKDEYRTKTREQAWLEAEALAAGRPLDQTSNDRCT